MLTDAADSDTFNIHSHCCMQALSPGLPLCSHAKRSPPLTPRELTAAETENKVRAHLTYTQRLSCLSRKRVHSGKKMKSSTRLKAPRETYIENYEGCIDGRYYSVCTAGVPW